MLFHALQPFEKQDPYYLGILAPKQQPHHIGFLYISAYYSSHTEHSSSSIEEMHELQKAYFVIPLSDQREFFFQERMAKQMTP